MPSRASAASGHAALTTQAAESAKGTRGNQRSKKASFPEDAEYIPELEPEFGAHYDDFASSSSNSTALYSVPPKRKVSPKNLKEESSDDELAAPKKRPATDNNKGRGLPVKKARKEFTLEESDALGTAVIAVIDTCIEKSQQLREAQNEISTLEIQVNKKANEACVAKNKATALRESDDAETLSDAWAEIKTLKAKLERTRLLLSERDRDLREARQSKHAHYFEAVEDIYERERHLESALRRSQEECEKAQEKVRELGAELLELENEQNQDLDYVNNKVTDDEILRRWTQLSYAIKQLASQMLKHESAEDTPRETLPHHEEVMLLLDSIKEAPGGISLFVQRFIWTRIYKGIFLGTRKTWGGLVGTRFMHFVQFLQDNEFGLEEAEAFSFVKGRAASLLDKIFEQYENTGLGGMVAALAKDLAILTPPGSEDDFDTQMKDILTKACELNRIFVLSRAFFVPSLVEPGTEVDEDKMDICYYHIKHPDSDESLELDLIISPMVEKIGSADGWDFHKRWTICKAIVTVK